MAFKMKGPSLLKMVKQMREGSPMKKDSAASKVGAKLGELAKANTKKKVKKPSDFLIDKYGEDSVRKAFNYGPDEKIGYSPVKQDKKEDPNAQTVEVKEGKSTRKVTPRVISPAEQKLIDADKKQKAARKAAKKEKMRKEIMEERKLVDIPKKKIQPLPVKTDAELKKVKKDRPEPTFEGTDEFRSLDEIRSASRK